MKRAEIFCPRCGSGAQFSVIEKPNMRRLPGEKHFTLPLVLVHCHACDQNFFATTETIRVIEDAGS